MALTVSSFSTDVLSSQDRISFLRTAHLYEWVSREERLAAHYRLQHEHRILRRCPKQFASTFPR